MKKFLKIIKFILELFIMIICFILSILLFYFGWYAKEVFFSDIYGALFITLASFFVWVTLKVFMKLKIK